MSEMCQTVKIKSKNEAGYVVINESDFNEEKHKLYEKPVKDTSRGLPTLQQGIQTLIDEGKVKEDKLPSLDQVRKFFNDPGITKKIYEACIKEHFTSEK